MARPTMARHTTDNSRSWKSGALIVATVATAAGLNLGVMQLGQQTEKSTTTESVPAPADAPDANPTGEPGADPAEPGVAAPAGQTPAPPLPAASADLKPGQIAGSSPVSGVTPATRPPTATTQYLTYDVSGIATLVVAVDGTTSVQLASATPQPGWTYTIADSQPTRVDLAFANAATGQGATVALDMATGHLEVTGTRTSG